MAKLRVGLIVDSFSLSPQWGNFLSKSLQSDHYEVTHFVFQKRPDVTHFKKLKIFVSRYGWREALRLFTFSTLSRFELSLVRTIPEFRKPDQPLQLRDFGIKTIIVEPTYANGQLRETYPPEDIKTITTERIDVLVQSGPGILSGDILRCCRLGVLRFHAGNNKRYRGRPPGFWEVFEKSPSTGFTIQRLTETLDVEQVLFRGSIPTSWISALNSVRIMQQSASAMDWVLRELANNPTLVEMESAPYDRKVYKTPEVFTQMRYLLAKLLEAPVRLLRPLLRKKAWSIGFQFVEDFRNTLFYSSKRIPNPKDRFFADPFVWSDERGHHVFCEDYDFKLKKGHISVLKVYPNGNWEFLGPAIIEDFHLSFPYLFTFQGDLFMCPETSRDRSIKIYKCDQFPLQWTLHEEVMKGVKAADTVILPLENRWILLTTMSASGGSELRSELYAFESDKPVNGNWSPIGVGPVIFDSLKGRNGGLIVEDNKIFRIAQRQGFDKYGAGLTIFELVDIGPGNLAERMFAEIGTDFLQNATGIHTFNHMGGLAVFDYLSRR